MSCTTLRKRKALRTSWISLRLSPRVSCESATSFFFVKSRMTPARVWKAVEPTCSSYEAIKHSLYALTDRG